MLFMSDITAAQSVYSSWHVNIFFCLLAARCSFLTNAYGLKGAGGKTRTAACTALPEDLIWIKREMKSCANLCPCGKKKNLKKKSCKFMNRLPCHEVWLIKVAAGSGIAAIRWLMRFGAFSGPWLDGHVSLSCYSEDTSRATRPDGTRPKVKISVCPNRESPSLEARWPRPRPRRIHQGSTVGGCNLENNTGS